MGSVLSKFREKLQEHELDGFIVTQADNRRYLSGFSGSAGILLITPETQHLITDSRYYERVVREAPGWTLVKAKPKIHESLKELLDELSLRGKKIGFEADHVTVSQMREWQASLDGIVLKETSTFVMTLRSVKTMVEQQALRQAIQIADQAMAYIYQWIQPGMTEKEVAWELEVYMRTHGAEALAFDTIVAAGANGAIPHATPSNYEIQLGDPVVIDMGCVVNGYHSDLTRTFSVGQPNQAQYRMVWELVDRANAVATAGIKAGLPGDKADALARDVIKAAGFGDNFGHTLGHGVGLAIHEYPRLSYTTDTPLQANEVVTIEPGVYLPGEFGVRIEDVVLVTDDGVEVLTGVPKIQVLGR